jgi:hypothetical protein
VASATASYLASHLNQGTSAGHPGPALAQQSLVHGYVVGPPRVLEPVLRAVQQATRVATGRDGKLHYEPWTPHITLAYGNSARPASPVIEALGRELPSRRVAISSISLVSQAPEQLWTWRLLTKVPFGTELA